MGSYEVITPSGRLDAENVKQFKQQIHRIVHAKPDTLVINLANVAFMDSSGLGALIVALKEMKTIGGRLVLCSPTSAVTSVLELASAKKLFETYANQTEIPDAMGAQCIEF